MYKLTIYDTILRLQDNAFIPKDNNNADYRKYLSWVQQGNQPEPAEVSLTTPSAVSRFQAMTALYEAGLLPLVDDLIVNSGTELQRLAWKNISEFQRTSPFLLHMAQSLGLTEADLDALFLRASQIQI